MWLTSCRSPSHYNNNNNNNSNSNSDSNKSLTLWQVGISPPVEVVVAVRSISTDLCPSGNRNPPPKKKLLYWNTQWFYPTGHTLALFENPTGLLNLQA